jgi:DNA polymerase-4
MDAINNRYGEFTLTFGTLVGNIHGSRVIPPAWRPKGTRSIDVE